MVKASAKMCNVFYRFWRLPSIGIIECAVLLHYDLYFQSQAFSCFAFVVEIMQWQWMSPTDLLLLAVEVLLLMTYLGGLNLNSCNP